MDGRKLLAFSQIQEETLRQAVKQILKVIGIFPLVDLVELGPNVDTVEPAHKV